MALLVGIGVFESTTKGDTFGLSCDHSSAVCSLQMVTESWGTMVAPSLLFLTHSLVSSKNDHCVDGMQSDWRLVRSISSLSALLVVLSLCVDAGDDGEEGKVPTGCWSIVVCVCRVVLECVPFNDDEQLATIWCQRGHFIAAQG